MAWNEFWGAYDNTGPYNNVVVGGSPNSTGPYGVPLGTAHSSGYGYGVQFTDNGNFNIKFELNLVSYSVTDSGQYRANQRYVTYGGTYDYYLTISTSNNNQSSWSQLYKNKVFVHSDSGALLYRSGWQQTVSQWSGLFTIPTDTTHVKIELQGEDATFPHQNIYSISQIIPDFKPWAIRKNGQWKTLNRTSGWYKIRKNGWTDKSIMNGNDTGKTNKGVARIRQSGSWKGQGKIGNL